jgi:invasion protein IalB
VSANPGSLVAGSYSGDVVVTIVEETNSRISIPVNLTLTSKSSVAVAPTITSQPASQTVTAGQAATFAVAATGTSPMTFQWSKNGGALSGATSSSYTTAAETMTDNQALFTVTVTNSAGNAASNPAVLTVNPAAVAPAITTQPSSQTLNAGQTATFNVAATGTTPLTYQWNKNGAAIGGATSSTYTTPAETTSDNKAQFTVVVTNAAGTATSNPATLTVNAVAVAPAISTQPASQSVIAGNTAAFTVTAAGTTPLTYQWSKNGAAIGGASSSTYTTPAETTADNNAKFSVTVSNSAGNATSNAATLTVTASTSLLNSSSTSLSFGNVNVSSNGNQTVTLTNAGSSTITISNVTIAGAGFNVTGVSSGLMLSPGQTATLTATFSPSAAGNVTGSVAVASNATNSPDTIALAGTGVAVVNHSVALTWTASTSTVVGYNTYSGTASGGPYTKLTSAPVASTAYTDTTVQAGQTYYYVVTAVNSSNEESTYSVQVSATIP